MSSDIESLVSDFLRSRTCTFPYIERFGAEDLEPTSIVEMTLNVEGIVDGGVDVEEPVCTENSIPQKMGLNQLV